MKIIKFRNTDNPEKLEIDVIPDSAIQKSGKPFFVPDFASRFQFSAAAAVHVCRLGKNIAQRFANRYYEEAGLCLVFEAKDLLDTLNANGKPIAMATSFDASHRSREARENPLYLDLSPRCGSVSPQFLQERSLRPVSFPTASGLLRMPP